MHLVFSKASSEEEYATVKEGNREKAEVVYCTLRAFSFYKRETHGLALHTEQQLTKQAQSDELEFKDIIVMTLFQSVLLHTPTGVTSKRFGAPLVISSSDKRTVMTKDGGAAASAGTGSLCNRRSGKHWQMAVL